MPITSPLPMRIPNSAELAKMKKKIRDQKIAKEDFIIRIHRAISWLRRYEAMKTNQDTDMQVITLWIAFNALYGDATMPKDTVAWRSFVEKIRTIDNKGKIHQAFCHNVKDAKNKIVKDTFLYAAFWYEQTKMQANQNLSSTQKPWREQYDKEMKEVSNRARNKTQEDWVIILNRVYTCRNHLVHGCSTHNSKTNRAQIDNVCALLSVFVPLLIELMLTNVHAFEHPLTIPVIGPPSIS